MDPELQSSQASSHFLLDPVSGSMLFSLENARREDLRRKGTLRTGCREIDEQVLLDGFERGCVAGISAEDIDMGLLLGLQTIAHNLVHEPEGRPYLRRAAIITTLAAPVILPQLRDVIRTQVEAKLGRGSAAVGARVRQCLERISVSRVFDVEGLWEVLTELEAEPPKQDNLAVAEDIHVPIEAPVPAAAEAEPKSSPLSSPPSSIVEPEPVPSRKERTEVLDSEDEGDLLSSSPASPAPHLAPSQPVLPVEEPKEPTPTSPTNKPTGNDGNFPGFIFITHFSTLLNALFGQRDKSSARSTLQLLSSHIRYLSSSLGSLVLLLNSTTNTPSNAATSKAPSGAPNTSVPPGLKVSERPLDPTLRSIFNAPPATHTGYGPDSLTLSRRNKPAFGLTFSQFLDLHLLCTRLPRSREDAEALYAPSTTTATHAQGQAGHRVRYTWVVEVLLDESGCWDAATGERIDREQRWGAVDWKEGVGIVDAFPDVGRLL